MSNWKYGFIPYFSNDPKEVLSVLRDAGYGGVEWIRYLHYVNADELKVLAAQTKEYGMEICSLMCSQDLVTLDESARTERVGLVVEAIEAAASASVKTVNLTTGPAEWGENFVKLGRDIKEGQAWDLVIDSFNKIVEAAEKNHVTVTVEAAFNNVVRDYYTLREFLEHFDSPNLAVNMDPSHLVLVGNDIGWVVRKLGKKIKHVHAKDVFGRPGTEKVDFYFPMLGEGQIEWADFFGALKEIGYDGYLSVEFEANNYLKNIWDGDWVKAAKACKEQLDALTKLG
jgi:sugar phosphate isomerase/epimerase